MTEITLDLKVNMTPIKMILHCPRCGTKHVDRPDPASGWDNPPHRSHLCGSCQFVFRPADVETEGVEAIETRGASDSPPEEINGKIEWRGDLAYLTSRYVIRERLLDEYVGCVGKDEGGAMYWVAYRIEGGAQKDYREGDAVDEREAREACKEVLAAWYPPRGGTR